jgi:hypothetical protein
VSDVNQLSPLRRTALECVRLVTRDLTDPAIASRPSAEVELSRYSTLASWVEVGSTIASGGWSDEELETFVEECGSRFEECQVILAR